MELGEMGVRWVIKLRQFLFYQPYRYGFLHKIRDKSNQDQSESESIKMKGAINAILLLLLASISPPVASGHTVSSRSSSCRRHRRPLAAVLPPAIVKNLATGSVLKCLADLTGGLVSSKYHPNCVQQVNLNHLSN